TQRRQGAVASLRILASDAAPHPGLPPHAGEGAGRPSRLHARGPPSPVRGGGLGWGQSPTAAPQILASDTAPIPAFPRMRGKEQGCPAASTPVAPSPRP